MRRGTERWSTPLVAALVVAAGVLVVVPTAGAQSLSVATEAEYRAALATFSADTSGPHIILLTADITLSEGTDPTYSGTEPLTLDGNGHTIDANGTSRILVVHNGGAPEDEPALLVTDATLTGGFATLPGGAIYSFGEVTIESSTLSNNATSDLGGAAVAVIGIGDLIVRGSTVAGNHATGNLVFGAVAALGESSTLYVENSTISDNTATAATSVFGVGIGTAGTADVIVVNSTISGNSATANSVYGGGIGIGGNGNLTVVNSTITGNLANGMSSSQGGGIAATYDVSLTHATVASNSAATGANLYGAVSTVQPFGSVFADPLGGGTNCAPYLTGSTVSSGYNHSTDASCGLGATGDVESGSDPRLGPLGPAGGLTDVMVPGTGSPLVDAIPLADCSATITVDQLGGGRPSDGDEDGLLGCDVGSVEVQYTAPVTQYPPPVVEPTFTG